MHTSRKWFCQWNYNNPILSALHSVLLAILGNIYYNYHSHFTGEKVEIQVEYFAQVTWPVNDSQDLKSAMETGFLTIVLQSPENTQSPLAACYLALTPAFLLGGEHRG